jgi:uncharacterized protein YkwD
MLRAVASSVLVVLVGCTDDPTVEDDVGDAEYCESVGKWTREASTAEDALLDAVNEARRQGGMCGEEFMPPSSPLELSPELRCASRVHARDLSASGTVSHEGSDGSTTLERIGLAGYADFPRHELLAGDFVDAREVAAAWLDEPANCVALLDSFIVHAGPGAHENSAGDNIAWVFTTGELRPE